MLKRVIIILPMLLLVTSAFAWAKNPVSFSTSKKILREQIYVENPQTLYCSANFDLFGNIQLPEGFYTERYQSRSSRIEWEHIVPAENFGRTFSEWRNGHSMCVSKTGTSYKGRRCAEKTNPEFRTMLADMYNLYPAIGSVNAARKNYNFAILPDEPYAFGICPVKISKRKVEPPESVRGVIARTYKYMAATYSRYRMSKQQARLMDAWDSLYPVDFWECFRAKKIEELQGNENIIVKSQCIESQLW